MGNDAVSLYILIESLKYKQSRKKTQNGTSLLLSYFCRFQKIISLYFMEMHTPHIKRAQTCNDLPDRDQNFLELGIVQRHSEGYVLFPSNAARSIRNNGGQLNRLNDCDHI